MVKLLYALSDNLLLYYKKKYYFAHVVKMLQYNDGSIIGNDRSYKTGNDFWNKEIKYTIQHDGVSNIQYELKLIILKVSLALFGGNCYGEDR